MYKNVGKKIQKLAKFVAWLGIIFFVVIGVASTYGGLNTNNYQMIAQGIVFLVVCPILCWLSSLTAFGFGTLIETNEQMKNDIQDLNNTVKDLQNK